MIATNKLRFVKRMIGVTYQGHIDINELKEIKILQQWWEEDGGDYDGLGEWRDVPIEEQA